MKIQCRRSLLIIDLARVSTEEASKWLQLRFLFEALYKRFVADSIVD